MAASYEQSSRIRETSHFDPVLLLLLFVLNCRGLGDCCKRRAGKTSQNSEKGRFPRSRPQKTGATYTHTNTHRHIHTSKHTYMHTRTRTHSQFGRSIFCVFFSQTNICGLPKNSQHNLFIIYYFLFFMICIYPHTVSAKKDSLKICQNSLGNDS